MSMLNHLSAFAGRSIRAGAHVSPRYAVSLIDRNSGKPHVICGIPLVLMTADPFETSQELMRNRDPSRWQTSVARLGMKEARA